MINMILAALNENREKSITVKLIILNRFQHPFQEGLLEKVLLKIPATSSVFLVKGRKTKVKGMFLFRVMQEGA